MTSSTQVHPSAIIETGASIGEGVKIGPFCYIGPKVVLGNNVELKSHVTIEGKTSIGENSRVFPQAVLGCEPQNFRHKGGETRLEIGTHALIREGVTIHVGSDSERGITSIGNHCVFLGFSHVAHDCALGNHVTMTQGAVLGGHCELGDHVIVGGLAAVHQFARVGHHAFVGGMTGLEGDLIPYGMAIGNRAHLRGLNLVGMKRGGMARSDIQAMRKAFGILFDENFALVENIERVRQNYSHSPVVSDVLNFLTTSSKRNYCTPKKQVSRNEPTTAS